MTHPIALGVEMRGGREVYKQAVAGVDMEEGMKDGMEEAGEADILQEIKEVERAERADMVGYSG